MSLVPILYTSLILFAIVMVIIVSVSYIAFRIRNRSSEETTEPQYEYVPQPSYIRNNGIRDTVYPSGINTHNEKRFEAQREGSTSIKVVRTIKNPELKKTAELPLPSRRTQVLNSDDLREPRRTEEYSRSTNYYTGERNDIPAGSRTNSGSFRKRVEILNKVVPKESPKESFNVSGSGSIALPKYYRDFKAIHYYSDNDDESLYKPYRYYE